MGDIPPLELAEMQEKAVELNEPHRSKLALPTFAGC
eukprot:SAG11_NODE_2052_length_3879_cov_2.030159_1_plen_35_part_10